MVALVGIARAVVSMTVSASDAATVADKVGTVLALEALLCVVLAMVFCYCFPFMGLEEECVFICSVHSCVYYEILFHWLYLSHHNL